MPFCGKIERSFCFTAIADSASAEALGNRSYSRKMVVSLLLWWSTDYHNRLFGTLKAHRAPEFWLWSAWDLSICFSFDAGSSIVLSLRSLTMACTKQETSTTTSPAMAAASQTLMHEQPHKECKVYAVHAALTCAWFEFSQLANASP